MGLELPQFFPPGANYIPAVSAGNLLFLAQMCLTSDGKPLPGKLGETMTLEQGYEAARIAAPYVLAVTKDATTGGLERVCWVVSMHGMANATPDFDGHAQVKNGASDLFVHALGKRRRHTRAVSGLPSLPGGGAIEIECVLELG
jgi:enamine deaminase RidA (YjgF/YER057c/UK114 family)